MAGSSCALLLVIASVAVMGLDQGREIAFRGCSTSTSTPRASIESIVISPCANEPCQFLRDVRMSTVFIFFVQEGTYSTAKLQGTVLINGHAMAALPIDDDNLCHLLVGGGSSCPLKSGNRYFMAGNVTIPAAIPNLPEPLTFEVKAVGSQSEELFCVQYDVRI